MCLIDVLVDGTFEMKVGIGSLNWKVVGLRLTSYGSVRGYDGVSVSHFLVQHVLVEVSENWKW